MAMIGRKNKQKKENRMKINKWWVVGICLALLGEAAYGLKTKCQPR